MVIHYNHTKLRMPIYKNSKLTSSLVGDGQLYEVGRGLLVRPNAIWDSLPGTFKIEGPVWWELWKVMADGAMVSLRQVQQTGGNYNLLLTLQVSLGIGLEHTTTGDVKDLELKHWTLLP